MPSRPPHGHHGRSVLSARGGLICRWQAQQRPNPPSSDARTSAPRGRSELHFDSPLTGTLECIIFSSSDEAVFAGKCGNLTETIKLDEPKLILLDSKRLKHAAQRNAAAAQAAFN
jgi:hypothetical protein